MRHCPPLAALSNNQLAVIVGAAALLAATMLVAFGKPSDGRAAEAALPVAQPPVAGDSRLRIPAIGLDASVGVRQVTKDGGLPRPPRAVDVVWYDFSLHPGIGGVPGAAGNTVLTGRVDAGSSEGHTGTHYAGASAFTDLGLVRPGHRIEMTRGGQAIVYRVVSVEVVNEETADWRAVFASTPVETLTLFTCTGEFDPRHSDYVEKTVVKAVRVLGEAKRLEVSTDGRFLTGAGGTSDPLELATAQQQQVTALHAQDSRGGWLTFVPGAPSFVNTLIGQLRPDTQVVARLAR
ncbi:MAG: class F sortase [Dehalococcoidia bacterium]|nr:MAG: class F sortase [Dehalococcoidia bacterium]